MESFKTRQNIVISGGPFNDTKGGIKAYNSILTTQCTSTSTSTTSSSYLSSGSVALSSRSVALSSGSVALSSTSSWSRWYSAEEDPFFDRNRLQLQPFERVAEGSEEAPDAPEIEAGDKIEEDNAEDGIVSDGNGRINRTYQFYNCQAVYMNAFNARGVKVKDSGNNFPQVTYNGGTVAVHPGNDKLPSYIGEDGPSSSAQAQNLIKSGAQYRASWGQPPQYQHISHRFAFASSPTISPPPLHLTGDSPSYLPTAQSEPHSALPFVISSGPGKNQVTNKSKAASSTNAPLPTLDEGQGSMSSRESDKLPAAVKTRLVQANSHQNTPKTPAPTNLPRPKRRPLPLPPFLPLHTNFHPNSLLSSILQPFPDAVQGVSLDNIDENEPSDTPLQPNRHPHQYRPESPLAWQESNSERLEHLLESALETALATALIIQTSDISSSPEILSPRAQNTLKALNALVSVETPIPSPRTIASETSTHFKSVRKVARWLRIPRSAKY